LIPWTRFQDSCAKPLWNLLSTDGVYAEVEFLDSGEVVATCSNGAGSTVSLGSDLRTTLRTIQAFLGG
jgi:hypothetical protein